MSNLELVIRPFQTRNVTPPTIIPGEPKTIETPVLLIGSEGVKLFKLDVAVTTNVETINQTTYTETSRTTHTERVTNPDDPAQHVDVKSVDRVTVKDNAANPMSPQPSDELTFNYKQK